MSRYPTSVPLHPQLNTRLRSIDCSSLDAVYQNARRQLLETFHQLIDDPSTKNVQHHIEKLLTNCQELCATELDSSMLSANLGTLKDEYIRASKEHQPVSLENWTAYGNEISAPPTLFELFEEMSPSESSPQLSNEDKIFRSLPYIWKDPTSIVPDFSATSTEDDLHIEGGKIELACPITLKPFENPMISIKCNHVFDKEGLSIYFNEAESRDCPQDGCSQKLTLRDFAPDNLMKLRCKIAKFKQDLNISTSDEQTKLDII